MTQLTVWTQKIMLTIGSDNSVVMETGIEDATIKLHHDCADIYESRKFTHNDEAITAFKKFHSDFIEQVNKTYEENPGFIEREKTFNAIVRSTIVTEDDFSHLAYFLKHASNAEEQDILYRAFARAMYRKYKAKK
jgi:hypothetical protein